METKKVKLADYDIMNTLGTGSFGRVKLAKQKSNNKYVALKMLKKIEIIRLKQVDHIVSEFKILKQIKHPFLVNIRNEYMVTLRMNDIYILFQNTYKEENYLLIQGMLALYKIKRLSKSLVYSRFYSAQVVLMFEYLHTKNIVYRDLKPENLLVQGDGYLKLTDFGFAKVVEDRTYTLCGTPEYLAPEILLNKVNLQIGGVWEYFYMKCLQVLVLQLKSKGIDPFNDEDPMAIYQKILKGKVKFPRNFDNEAKSLVKHLLEQDVTKRFGNLKNGVEDIKQHKWYETLNWKDLFTKRIKPLYIPIIQSDYDTSNFATYPESSELPDPVKQKDDPFEDW
ncbi:unnamed protein product [Paramecium sonneborni]|uniref:cAMP-dependent protein kinase n=1 Tax=Paramecium sonneborni TaxID=65129 RepID=A0A8S1N857_9CILI|nr:unnamed protein product [Paramecium sonneborni]